MSLRIVRRSAPCVACSCRAFVFDDDGDGFCVEHAAALVAIVRGPGIAKSRPRVVDAVGCDVTERRVG